MIQKSQEQDIDREGRRLLREAFERLVWVLTGFDEDYGFDYDVQVFVDGSPNGLWFKVQLKSSAASNHSGDGRYISQSLSVDHARHYALELREPFFLVHADLQLKKIFWSAPQIDAELIATLNSMPSQSSLTVRIPTSNSIPETAEGLLQTVEQLHIVLANRTLVASSVSSFAESLKYQPGENRLREEFQRKNNILRLRKIRELVTTRQYSEARLQARVVVSDPDSSIEDRFWPEENIGAIDWADAVTQNRPQPELPLIYLNNGQGASGTNEEGAASPKNVRVNC